MQAFESGTLVEPHQRTWKTPPPSIIHLMLWMTCCAAYLAITEANLYQPVVWNRLAALRLTEGVLRGTLFGVLWAGAIVLGIARIRGHRSVFREPGHWLLMIHGTTTALFFTVHASFVRFQSQWYIDESSTWWRWTFFVMLAIGCLLAARSNRTWAWRASFAAFVPLYVYEGQFGNASSPSPFMNAIPEIGHFVCSVGVVVGVLSDAAAGRRRDWLHWTGVMAYLALESTHIVCSTLFALFTR